jgi:hypothetical protein
MPDQIQLRRMIREMRLHEWRDHNTTTTPRATGNPEPATSAAKLPDDVCTDRANVP